MFSKANASNVNLAPRSRLVLTICQPAIENDLLMHSNLAAGFPVAASDFTKRVIKSAKII